MAVWERKPLLIKFNSLRLPNLRKPHIELHRVFWGIPKPCGAFSNLANASISVFGALALLFSGRWRRVSGMASAPIAIGREAGFEVLRHKFVVVVDKTGFDLRGDAVPAAINIGAD